MKRVDRQSLSLVCHSVMLKNLHIEQFSLVGFYNIKAI